jgi:hypothetical protein
MRDPPRREREPRYPPAPLGGALGIRLVHVYRAQGPVLLVSLILSSTTSWTWHIVLFNSTEGLTILD